MFVALLRGINVGGHHKVPMADLRELLQDEGFTEVQTLLNSGNVILSTSSLSSPQLAQQLARCLDNRFGFAIPVQVYRGSELTAFYHLAPFREMTSSGDLRFYVSFLPEKPADPPALPWISDDESLQIVSISGRMVGSIVNIRQSKTPDAMKILERFFGKGITTRNWNTLEKIVARMDAGN